MELSYLIQSPKFSWVWSQSHQRIANNWIKARAIFIVDAHRDDGERFVLRADEKVTAFVELELAIRGSSSFTRPCTVKRYSAGTETVRLKSHGSPARTSPSLKRI